tara:strand:+ start:662 stop:1297 length:636 start_codon:yes stop_codon:yes gene_type:complete
MKDLLFDNKFTCVAVSKTKPIEDIEKIYKLGHKDFGENKVQELIEKQQKLPKDIRWHMIGHLQTNKVKKVVPIACLIHSVDSLKLIEIINKESKKLNKVTCCLLQVNISGEDSKYGLSAENLKSLVNNNLTNEYKNVQFKGLMGMASFSNDTDLIKRQFKKLKQLFEDSKEKINDFRILSMGMSNDYKIALEEGSNMIRIGSKIFGERNYL